jgi:hypothetical protein
VNEIRRIFKNVPRVLRNATFLHASLQDDSKHNSLQKNQKAAQSPKAKVLAESTGVYSITLGDDVLGAMDFSPAQRGVIFLHEAVHCILMPRQMAADFEDHPGMDDPAGEKKRYFKKRQRLGIAFESAVKNPYCYQYFVSWGFRTDNPSSAKAVFDMPEQAIGAKAPAKAK